MSEIEGKGRAADGWLLVKEAAAETGITTGRIYTLINSRRLAAELREVGRRGARVLVVRPQDVLESDRKARDSAVEARDESVS
jgi:hypothetical protein